MPNPISAQNPALMLQMQAWQQRVANDAAQGYRRSEQEAVQGCVRILAGQDPQPADPIGAWFGTQWSRLTTWANGVRQQGSIFGEATPPVMQQPAAAPDPTPAPTPAPAATSKPSLPGLEAYGNDLKTATDINNFCWHAAKQLLGRKPNWSEVNFWREQIQKGNLNKEQAKDLIAKQVDAVDAPIYAAYREKFGRDMSEQERAIYKGQREGGMKTEDIVKEIGAVKSNLDAGIINGNAELDGLSALAHQNQGGNLTAEEQRLGALELANRKVDMAELQIEGRDAMADPCDTPASN